LHVWKPLFADYAAPLFILDSRLVHVLWTRNAGRAGAHLPMPHTPTAGQSYETMY
jgi:hypothetical protein